MSDLINKMDELMLGLRGLEELRKFVGDNLACERCGQSGAEGVRLSGVVDSLLCHRCASEWTPHVMQSPPWGQHVEAEAAWLAIQAREQTNKAGGSREYVACLRLKHDASLAIYHVAGEFLGRVNTPSEIPTKDENPTGLHQRYEVRKLDGENDPRAVYFVLRLDVHGDDPRWTAACRNAARDLGRALIAENHLPEVVET